MLNYSVPGWLGRAVVHPRFFVEKPMSHPYSEETHRILNDFLETLGRDERTDPDLLA